MPRANPPPRAMPMRGLRRRGGTAAGGLESVSWPVRGEITSLKAFSERAILANSFKSVERSYYPSNVRLRSLKMFKIKPLAELIRMADFAKAKISEAPFLADE